MAYEEKETEVMCPVCDTVNKITGMGNCTGVQDSVARHMTARRAAARTTVGGFVRCGGCSVRWAAWSARPCWTARDGTGRQGRMPGPDAGPARAGTPRRTTARSATAAPSAKDTHLRRAALL